MYFVSRRFGMGLQRWEGNDPVGSGGSLYDSMMYSFENSASRAPSEKVVSQGLPVRSWFDKAGVLISRPGANSSSQFAVALKGGHKALLLDPGGEVYTARTFSSKRYDSNVLNSFGHAVPIVAGKLQRTGGKARGEILESEFTDGTDTLALDISSAYDVPELERLERTFVYSRSGSGSLRVTDKVRFSKPSAFATALITLDKWKKLSASSLMIYDSDEALRVDIETGGIGFEVKGETIDEDVSAPRRPIRLGINLKNPVSSAIIAVKIAPMEEAGAR